MDTVGDLPFPVRGFLQTRRGAIVEVALSQEPIGPTRAYLRVPEGAGELRAGLWSTEVAALLDDEVEAGWIVTTVLVPEEPDAAVRRDPVIDPGYDWEETDLVLAEVREDLEPDGPAPETEGEIDPFGLWALDDEGRAFVIAGGLDDESGLLWLHPASDYGRALHPGVYDAEPTGDADAAAALEATGVQELQVYLYDGHPDEPYGVWRIGSRAALETEAAEAGSGALPPFDPTDWLRWLVPVGGGDPVPVVPHGDADGRSLNFDVLGAHPPAWAAGRSVTAPGPRPGQSHAERREVPLSAKPIGELRSGNPRIRKRPPAPVGRFVLEAEGWMPEGWARLG